MISNFGIGRHPQTFKLSQMFLFSEMLLKVTLNLEMQDKTEKELGKFAMVSQPIDLVWLVVGSSSIDLVLVETLIEVRLNCIISRRGFGDPDFPLIFLLVEFK